MLKINRKLYLNEPSNHKLENYLAIKNVTNEFIQVIKDSLWKMNFDLLTNTIVNEPLILFLKDNQHKSMEKDLNRFLEA